MKIHSENAVEYYMGSSNNCTIWIQDETTGKTTKVTYDKSTRTRTEEIYDSEKYYKQSFVQYDETGKVIDWSNTSVQPTQSNQSAKTTDNTNMEVNDASNLGTASDESSIGSDSGSDMLGESASIYVSPTGDDSNDGSSSESAVASISKAVELTSDGGTIYLAAGEYNSSSTNPSVGSAMLSWPSRRGA